MNRSILVIAAIVCGSNYIFSQQGAKIIFKDVGQGNCTLVLPYEKDVPMLLVDCGSSMIHHRRVKGPKVSWFTTYETFGPLWLVDHNSPEVSSN